MWQGSRDSNPKPTVLETVTLPIEPLPCKLGKYLSSQRANPRVLSAYRDLTSGFGMGPGVPP